MDTFLTPTQSKLCHTWPSATLERLQWAMQAYLGIRNLSRFLKRDFRTLELAHYQISHLSRDDLYHNAFPEHWGLFWLISHLGPNHLRRRSIASINLVIWPIYNMGRKLIREVIPNAPKSWERWFCHAMAFAFYLERIFGLLAECDASKAWTPSCLRVLRCSRLEWFRITDSRSEPTWLYSEYAKNIYRAISWWHLMTNSYQ